MPNESDEKSREINVDLSKRKISRIYDLCNILYGSEFKKIYLEPRESFRVWLNEKTECDVNHITDMSNALDAWLVKLEYINRTKKS